MTGPFLIPIAIIGLIMVIFGMITLNRVQASRNRRRLDAAFAAEDRDALEDVPQDKADPARNASPPLLSRIFVSPFDYVARRAVGTLSAIAVLTAATARWASRRK